MTLKRLVLKEGQNIPETIYTFYISELLTLEKGSGNWTTGYVQPKGTNDLIIFMNIGVPGKTGHDFDNKFDPQTNTIVFLFYL